MVTASTVTELPPMPKVVVKLTARQCAALEHFDVEPLLRDRRLGERRTLDLARSCDFDIDVPQLVNQRWSHGDVQRVLRLFGHDQGVIHSMKRTNGLPEMNDMLSERVID